MKTRYFILREIATGNTFPISRGNVSFTLFVNDLPPRLFKRHQDALLVLRHWCKGHSWIPSKRQWDEFSKPFIYDTKPVEGRDIEKFEIVPIDLVVENSDYAPCPTCKQYCHSIGGDALSGALMHFETMFSHRGDGIPTQHVFDEKTRDAAQILITAARGKQ